MSTSEITALFARLVPTASPAEITGLLRAYRRGVVPSVAFEIPEILPALMVWSGQLGKRDAGVLEIHAAQRSKR